MSYLPGILFSLKVERDLTLGDLVFVIIMAFICTFVVPKVFFWFRDNF